MPGQNFEFLGVTFDRKLTVNPHLSNLISTTRSLAIMAKRLTNHIPHLQVCAVMGALIRGRIRFVQ